VSSRPAEGNLAGEPSHAAAAATAAAADVHVHVHAVIMLAKKKAVDLCEDVFVPWNRCTDDDLTHRPRWMEYWTHGVAEVRHVTSAA
jgi:hypothetical protein